MKRNSFLKIFPRLSVILVVLVFCFFSISSLFAQVQKTTKKPVQTKIKMTDYSLESISLEDRNGNSLQAGESGWVVVKWKRTGAQPGTNVKLKVLMDGNNFSHSENESELSNITHRIPWTAVAGSHEIRAIIDYGNRVRESNEFNNVKKINIVILARPTLVVPKPDLRIKNFVALQDGSTQTTYDPSRPIELRCMWERKGPKITSDWRIQFFLNDRPIGIASTAAPSPDDTKGTFIKTYTLPKAGNWKVSCTVDVTEIVTEESENNNTRATGVRAWTLRR